MNGDPENRSESGSEEGKHRHRQLANGIKNQRITKAQDRILNRMAKFTKRIPLGILSALRGHQPAGDRRLSLRPSVLRTRGHGEPHPHPAEQHLPAPGGAVPYGCRSPGHLLTIAECCPGMLTNNGGKGGGSAVRKNRARTTDRG